MKFNLKTYKLLKLETYLKEKKFLILTTSVGRRNQIKQNQIFKKLNYNHYQIYNTLAKKVLKNSIYINYSSLIKSVITLLNIKKNNNVNNLKQLNNNTIIGLKINHKIYFTPQLYSKNLELVYKHNYINITRTLKNTNSAFRFKLSK